jgi:DNA-binding transcriptional regulator GbsR (MarR family)
MAKITKQTKVQQITNTILSDFNSDDSYREEARIVTENFLKSFGIFVGLYNKLNNTVLSVEDALYEDTIMQAYKTMSAELKTVKKIVGTPEAITKMVNKRPKSTKLLSYEAFKASNGSSCAHLIYTELKKSKEPMTRAELSSVLDLRISTVCGRINELEEAGLVWVVGTKVDEDSQRQVELLQTR